MDFSEQQIERYSRHILLPEVGGTGQERLLGARVLVVGAGGLGAPLLLYLAAAGIGTIGIVDADTVDLSNLQRQVVHEMSSLGRPKVESAAARIAALNPDVQVIQHPEKLTAANADIILSGYDIIADGTDNFAARYLLNDACFLLKKTLVTAAMYRFDGQLTVLKAHEAGCPCWRCLFPEPPPAGLVPTCSEAGVLGVLAGIVGSLQASEVLKEVLGIGESLAGTLLLYEALPQRFQRITVPKDPACPLCGSQPSITDLSGHAAS
jgi:molybdopterin-synthase adenylyltransferase